MKKSKKTPPKSHLKTPPKSQGKAPDTDASKSGGEKFEDIFERYSRFGDRESDGVAITLKNIDKWLKQAKLLGGKGPFTNADTAITFSKVARTKKHIDFDEFMQFLEHLAADKKVALGDLTGALIAQSQPGMTHVTEPISSGPAAENVERMTDASLYTGSHKEHPHESHGRSTESDTASKSKDSPVEKCWNDEFEEIFHRYSRFGDRETDVDSIALRNIDKWLNQANLLGGKGPITNADTAITFSKIARTKKRIDFEEFTQFLGQLASDKNMDMKALIGPLEAESQPGMTDVTEPITSGPVADIVERMTDTSLYTGSHKERFDEEGHGRGREGREDIVENEGYVTGFKKE